MKDIKEALCTTDVGLRIVRHLVHNMSTMIFMDEESSMWAPQYNDAFEKAKKMLSSSRSWNSDHVGAPIVDHKELVKALHLEHRALEKDFKGEWNWYDQLHTSHPDRFILFGASSNEWLAGITFKSDDPFGENRWGTTGWGLRVILNPAFTGGEETGWFERV